MVKQITFEELNDELNNNQHIQFFILLQHGVVLESTLLELNRDITDVLFLVDVDESEELCEKFNEKIQHLFF